MGVILFVRRRPHNPDLGATNCFARGHGCDLRVASSTHPYYVNPPTSSVMVNRSEYQPISQSVDEEEVDVTEPIPSTSTTQPRRSSVSKNIDLRKLDNAFKRYVPMVAFQGRF